MFDFWFCLFVCFYPEIKRALVRTERFLKDKIMGFVKLNLINVTCGQIASYLCVD